MLKAKDEEIAVSLAIVFTLNSIGLFLFPFIGHSLYMSQDSFRVWAALAIHDTSSVVGATAAFGATALAIGTTVKLTCALWITPIVLGYTFYKKISEKIHFPYFIIGFVLAAIVRSTLPNFNTVWDVFAFGGRRLLVLTLFLIGSGLTKDVLGMLGFVQCSKV
ncbi:MAG: putative sulfate exporter family transporter [Smithella sp.]